MKRVHLTLVGILFVFIIMISEEEYQAALKVVSDYKKDCPKSNAWVI